MFVDVYYTLNNPTRILLEKVVVMFVDKLALKVAECFVDKYCILNIKIVEHLKTIWGLCIRR